MNYLHGSREDIMSLFHMNDNKLLILVMPSYNLFRFDESFTKNGGEHIIDGLNMERAVSDTSTYFMVARKCSTEYSKIM